VQIEQPASGPAPAVDAPLPDAGVNAVRDTVAGVNDEVLIIGGGPAGLSAALILGRCRRRVIVIDAGKPRNRASHGLHGFLGHDGIAPAELLHIGREQLSQYDSVQIRDAVVTDVRQIENGFEVTLEDDSTLSARKLLLATGVIDHLPEIPGIDALYGRSVHHCPYCDGWEHRGEPLAVYGADQSVIALARMLTIWSRDVALCTGGQFPLSDEERHELARHGIQLREEPIASLEGEDGQLQRVVFTGGEPLPRRALFFHNGQHTRTQLARKLGCSFTEEEFIEADEQQMTCAPGIYVAGDAYQDVQLAIIAAAEGARAAFAINKALIYEDLVPKS
jgi:thioredoxin reductase